MGWFFRHVSIEMKKKPSDNTHRENGKRRKCVFFNAIIISTHANVNAISNRMWIWGQTVIHLDIEFNIEFDTVVLWAPTSKNANVELARATYHFKWCCCCCCFFTFYISISHSLSLSLFNEIENSIGSITYRHLCLRC